MPAVGPCRVFSRNNTSGNYGGRLVAVWRVVIVDDSLTMLAMLDHAFSKRSDFQVVGFASDATVAVEMIQKLAPDIVTLDLCMPYLDGAALLEMIRDQHGLCKIVVSDFAQKSLLLASKLREAGASACLGKSELINDPTAFFSKIDAAANALSKTGKRTGAPVDLPSSTYMRTNDVRSPSTLAFPIPANEEDRLALVQRKQLSNAVRERQFDLVTKHVATVTAFPICLLTFIDRGTQWVKSAYGLAIESTPRDQAFCNYTIAQGGIFAVADAEIDKRFARNPLVTGAPHIKSLSLIHI